MRLNISRAVLILLAGIAASGPLTTAAAARGEADRVSLAPALTDGPAGVYRVMTENKQTISTPGDAPKSLTYRLDARLRFEMKSAGADSADIVVTYERISLLLDSPGIKQEFDSDWPSSRDSESQFAPAVRGAVGKSLTLSISKDGKVGEVRGLDDVAPPGQQGDSVRQLLNPTGLQELVGAVFAPRPGETGARVGESWEETKSQPNLLGEIRLTEKSTLQKADGGRAVIATTGSGSLERRADAGAPRGAEFVTFKSATIAGETIWDAALGRVDRVNHTLTMEVVDNDPVREGKAMTQVVETRTVIEKLK